ncbi:hypothetical protein T552_00530 [Pneumocystis carinii B80]|uniref:ATP synthase mitochondrial F1 complex assembly factor 2 n=1 Tax=Pneumocystis carinii (strain B80) TaxID=1408658 RepID=A0A0W4ZR25_PNEC8|nr:hypothetical protein T552_00530 [Pneumocystis carinii B80]KTW30819.1 hypothetical protein T552_00530 [Pneumocystis carinii B80]
MLIFFILRGLRYSISKHSIFTLFQDRKNRFYRKLIHNIASKLDNKDFSDCFYLEKLLDGYQILLNNNPFKTPSGKNFKFPLRKHNLAHSLLSECRTSSSNFFEYHSLPLVSLSSRAIDVFSEKKYREKASNGLLKYLDTDTVLSFAPKNESGGDLLILQKKMWEPLHEWAQKYWNVEILKTNNDFGIIMNPQPEKTKKLIKEWVCNLDQWQFAALERAICLSKSFIIGAKMVATANSPSIERLDAEKAFNLAQLEILFEIERWGKIDDTHDVEEKDIKRLLETVCTMLKDQE